MKKAIVWMVALCATFGGALHAQDKDITGNWQGTLQAGNGLRTVLKITKDDGKLKAVMYSIDQGGQPIPVTSIALQGSAFSFAIKPLDLTYAGKLNPDGATIAGSATQGPEGHAQTHVLNFDHVTAENTWAIPEPPKPMAPDAKPKFDVVTVKPTDPNRQGKLFTFRGSHAMTLGTNVNDLITFCVWAPCEADCRWAGVVRHRQVRYRRCARRSGAAQLGAAEDADAECADPTLRADLPSRPERTLRLRAYGCQGRAEDDRDRGPAEWQP